MAEIAKADARERGLPGVPGCTGVRSRADIPRHLATTAGLTWTNESGPSPEEPTVTRAVDVQVPRRQPFSGHAPGRLWATTTPSRWSKVARNDTKLWIGLGLILEVAGLGTAVL